LASKTAFPSQWHPSGNAIPMATTGFVVADQLVCAALPVLEIPLDEPGNARPARLVAGRGLRTAGPGRA
jgi:hypothetical protein